MSSFFFLSFFPVFLSTYPLGNLCLNRLTSNSDRFTRCIFHAWYILPIGISGCYLCSISLHRNIDIEKRFSFYSMSAGLAPSKGMPEISKSPFNSCINNSRFMSNICNAKGGIRISKPEKRYYAKF